MQLTEDFPKYLTELADPTTYRMSFSALLNLYENIDLKVTEGQSQVIKKSTRKQSATRSWFSFKAGRISASIMMSCCQTNQDMPSQSLIKKICYPESYKFSSAATSWGCEHEKHALENYSKKCHKCMLIFSYQNLV